MLDVLPEVKEAVDSLTEEQPPAALAQSGIEEAKRQVASAAGRPRTHVKGQGFATDQQVKVAVETYAMNEALIYYTRLGTVTDTSRTESFDYAVEIDGASWHVEAKVTTGDLAEILLTPRQVRHANDYPRIALFVLSNITVTRDDHAEIITNGGRASIFHPWSLDRAQLSPIGYRYRLAGDAEKAGTSHAKSEEQHGQT